MLSTGFPTAFGPLFFDFFSLSRPAGVTVFPSHGRGAGAGLFNDAAPMPSTRSFGRIARLGVQRLGDGAGAPALAGQEHAGEGGVAETPVADQRGYRVRADRGERQESEAAGQPAERGARASVRSVQALPRRSVADRAIFEYCASKLSDD
jgi:hypothetical protein